MQVLRRHVLGCIKWSAIGTRCWAIQRLDDSTDGLVFADDILDGGLDSGDEVEEMSKSFRAAEVISAQVTIVQGAAVGSSNG